MQYIALLDCNNFFVSCERLFRPDLKHKPVVVLSSNDGCVIARSKEIKDMGISMGVPYFQIKDILQEAKAITFSTHFALYRDISKRVFEVVRETFDVVEQYSIDECFFSFESDTPLEVIRALKEQVEQRVGIPVSIGVSSSKTRAKYVNAIAKKTNGLAILSDREWENASATISLFEIWGVGRGRNDEFKKHGLATVADFCQLEPRVVEKLFGIEGSRLLSELKGISVSGVKRKVSAQQSIMNTRSFAKTTSSLEVLEDALLYHLHQGVKDLDAMNLSARKMRVLIQPSRHGDYVLQGSSKEVTFTATKDLFVLEKVALELLKACFKAEVPYKRAGVILSDLVSTEAQTMDLFGLGQESVKTESLTETLFSINTKHGKGALQLGRLNTKTNVWGVRKDLVSPAYTTNWSELKTVLAK